jgi:hypothetical protein
MENLTRYPWLMFAAAFVALWLASVMGSWLRRRNPSAKDEKHEDDLSIILGATLTLLALIIGFSISMASSRYDQRKNLEEAEANAIGTEMLRADLLPAADAANVRSLLSAYLDQRILFYINRDDKPIANRSLGCRPRTGYRTANSGYGAGARRHERRDQFAGLHASRVLEPASRRCVVAYDGHRTLF